jgi:DNA-binding NarL/FixJ family response regulator
MAKVLIVDDREDNLFALENVLKRLDVDIVKALTGQEALRAALNHEFALAILDVQMPVMDGYELATLLRSDAVTRDVPIIFLSAVYSAEPYVFRGYASGGVDFITKPFNPEILLSKVRVFLALHDQKAELAGHKARLESLVGRLEIEIEARRQAEDSLRKTNENLEHEVSTRTADLADTVAALRTANEQQAARATQLRALAGELTMAEHRERQHVSKILHDGLQQHLAIAKLQLSVMSTRLATGELRHAAVEVEHLMSESIQMCRSLSAELSPPVLHNNGLSAGLEWLGSWMREKHGFSIDLAIECRPELPEDVKILAFESVRELLFNAVKHAKVSRARVLLKQGTPDEICISVSDQGAGFDTRELKPEGDPGAGLGLFSIRERIGLIGGCLHIDSAPGKGSRFTLTIPHRTAPAAPRDTVARTIPADLPEAAQTLEFPGAVLRVLIVDDHTLFRDALTRLVNREPDLEVVGQAQNGREAIVLARKLKPDVILMDINMPEVDGIETTRLIHQEATAIRIIGLSMHADQDCARAMRHAGAVDYKNKGCGASELVAAIRACVPSSDRCLENS